MTLDADPEGANNLRALKARALAEARDREPAGARVDEGLGHQAHAVRDFGGALHGEHRIRSRGTMKNRKTQRLKRISRRLPLAAGFESGSGTGTALGAL